MAPSILLALLVFVEEVYLSGLNVENINMLYPFGLSTWLFLW